MGCWAAKTSGYHFGARPPAREGLRNPAKIQTRNQTKKTFDATRCASARPPGSRQVRAWADGESGLGSMPSEGQLRLEQKRTKQNGTGHRVLHLMNREGKWHGQLGTSSGCSTTGQRAAGELLKGPAPQTRMP